MYFECVINKNGEVAVFTRPLTHETTAFYIRNTTLVLVGNTEHLVEMPKLFQKALTLKNKLLLVECKGSHIWRETILSKKR